MARMNIDIDTAVELAQQWQSPAGRPNLPPSEWQECLDEVAETLRIHDYTVPSWIDEASPYDVAVPIGWWQANEDSRRSAVSEGVRRAIQPR